MKIRNDGYKKFFFISLCFFTNAGCAIGATNSHGLKFSTTGCGKPVRFSPNALEINKKWSDSVYEVKVKNQILCSAKIKNPSYNIEKNNILNLTYDADISGGASKCYCESSSTFFLKNIPRENDYEINFQVNYKY